MKPFRTARKRGEYFKDTVMMMEIVNTQTYKTITKDEAQALYDATKAMLARVKRGHSKRGYRKRKRGPIDPDVAKALNAATAAGRPRSEWKKFMPGGGK